MSKNKNTYNGAEPGTHYELHLDYSSLKGIIKSLLGCIEIWESLGGKKQDNLFAVIRFVVEDNKVRVSSLDQRQVIGVDGMAVIGLGAELNEDNDLGVHDSRGRKSDTYPNFFN